MSVWNVVCIALALVGFVISFLTWRSKGARRGMRAVAWSLIPLAAYLTGSASLLSRIGSAIASFAGSFVFSPKSWLGVSFLGLAVLIFVFSGGLPLLKSRKRKAARDGGAAGQGAAAVSADRRTPVTAGKAKRGATAQSDSDLDEVAEILRRHGIR